MLSSNTRTVWWGDLDWLPGAWQAAVSLPLLSATGEENKMKGYREGNHSAITVTGKTDLT